MAKKLFYQTEEFLKLKSHWDKELEKSGFVDIEKGESETVIRPQVIKTAKSQYDGGNTYYELCQAILRDFRFRKDIHRTIFSMHAEGKSERVISQWIKDNTSGSFSQKGINLLINRVKEAYLKGSK